MIAFVEGGVSQKPAPPVVMQPRIELEDGKFIASPTCWAAALSSWLKVCRGSDWTIKQLVDRFQPWLNGTELDLANLDEVADALIVRMAYHEKDRGDLTWDYLFDRLMISPLYTILVAHNPGHAIVIWGLAVDSAGTRDVRWMDPLEGGLRRGPLSKFQKLSESFVIGWARGG